MTSESSRPDTAKEPTSAPTGQASMSTASYAEGSDSGVGRSYVGAFGSVALLIVLLAISAHEHLVYDRAPHQRHNPAARRWLPARAVGVITELCQARHVPDASDVADPARLRLTCR